MNFSAEKSSRKWRFGAFGRTAAALVTVAVAALLVVPADPAMARRASHDIWGDLFGVRPPKPRKAAPRAAVPLPRPRPAEAPSAGRRRRRPRSRAAKDNGQERGQGGRQAGRQAAGAAAAFGLPAGADGCDRDRAQHSRYPRRRRLRRRGSGAAGGHRAAGQAPGAGEAGGDPPLHDGDRDRRLDPHRHRAAGGEASAAPISELDNFDSYRMPRPQPRRRREVVRARPRQCARRARLQARQWPHRSR